MLLKILCTIRIRGYRRYHGLNFEALGVRVGRRKEKHGHRQRHGGAAAHAGERGRAAGGAGAAVVMSGVPARGHRRRAAGQELFVAERFA